jgi:hypothetical protein
MIASLLFLVSAPFAVHVDGDGYMRFVRDGRTVYAREATLTVTDGKLASVAGPVLNPRVQVPSGTGELRVDLGGRVFGVVSGVEKELGRIVLAVFPDDVRLVVENGFLVSSYRPEICDAGTGSAGVLRSAQQVVAPIVSGIEVQLRDRVEVEGATFTLGEIAEVVAPAGEKERIAALEVATTPALGGVYRLTQEMVRQRLLRHGKEAEKYRFSGSNQVSVTRRGQEVTVAMFNDAAVKAARAELGAEVPLTPESGGVPVMAPLGRLELVSEGVTVNGSRVSVRVAIVVDGSRINSRTVQLDKADALSKLRVGQTVKVLVRSGAAVVETSGRVRSIDAATGTVVVLAATGAELIGRAVALDTIEVTL